MRVRAARGGESREFLMQNAAAYCIVTSVRREAVSSPETPKNKLSASCVAIAENCVLPSFAGREGRKKESHEHGQQRTDGSV